MSADRLPRCSKRSAHHKVRRHRLFQRETV